MIGSNKRHCFSNLKKRFGNTLFSYTRNKYFLITNISPYCFVAPELLLHPSLTEVVMSGMTYTLISTTIADILVLIYLNNLLYHNNFANLLLLFYFLFKIMIFFSIRLHFALSVLFLY